MLSYGYNNYWVASTIKDRILDEPSTGRAIVVEASLTRLAAARQLTLFGFEVTILEGWKHAGGRVVAINLGGSILTGRLGNPLGLLAQQLLYTLHNVRDQCPLYCANGKFVD